MKTIYKGSDAKITLYWKIMRGENKVTEDLSSLKSRVFLIGSCNTYSMEPDVVTDEEFGNKVLKVEVDASMLCTGVYDVKAVWEKNDGRNIMKSARTGVFAITDNSEEVGEIKREEVIRIVSYVESIGRDGLSAYEIAVIRGLNNGLSENDWVGNEVERIKAEQKRDSAEATRDANETVRKDAESDRMARFNTFMTVSTTAFSNAQTDRDTAFKQSQEDRETAFTKEITDFKTRFEEAEANRNDGEETRNQSYAEAEDKRDADYATAEANRDKKYGQAEATRNSTIDSKLSNIELRFEDAEDARKTIFNNNEDSRQTNEQYRIQAEGKREKDFQDNEKRREQTFQDNEVTRQSNEIKREEQESIRQQAEQIRIDTFDENERGRIAAENERKHNEAEREANEAIRQESYKDKLPMSAVVQETGEGENVVMSQKAVSGKLAELELESVRTLVGIGTKASEAGVTRVGEYYLNTNAPVDLTNFRVAVSTKADGSLVFADANVDENSLFWYNGKVQSAKDFLSDLYTEEENGLVSSKETCITNVPSAFGDTSAMVDIHTLDSARRQIPVLQRKAGHIISFRTDNFKWQTWRYDGNSSANDSEGGWHKNENWSLLATNKDLLTLSISVFDYHSIIASVSFNNNQLIYIPDGKPYDSVLYKSSEFVAIPLDCDRLHYTNPSNPEGNTDAGLVFYDKDKKPIAGKGISVYTINSTREYYDKICIIPQEARFVRFTAFNDNAQYGEFSCVFYRKAFIDDKPKQSHLFVGCKEIYLSDDTGNDSLDNYTTEMVYAEYDSLVNMFPMFFSRKADLCIDDNGDVVRVYSMRMQKPVVTNGTNVTGYNIWKEQQDRFNSIIILSGVHGDEKSSVIGVMKAIKDILSSKDNYATFIKSNMCVDIIPVVNPYGFDNMQRKNVNQVDLNRDYADFSTITTKAIAEYIKSVKDLKVVLDLHNTMATVSEFIAGQHYKNFPKIKEAYYELSSAILPKMAEIYADNGANYPYIILTTPDDTSGKGQLHWYLNENNIFGHTFEVPRSMEFGLVNNSKTCQITKNALINLMQIYVV